MTAASIPRMQRTRAWGRRVEWAVLLLLAVLPGLCAAGWVLLHSVVQAVPLVQTDGEVDTQDVERVVMLLRQHDPRHQPQGQMAAAVLDERDLEFLINHVAHRRLGAPVRIRLSEGQADLQASLRLPPNAFGDWLNVQATVRETPALPEVSALKLGSLPLPATLALPLLHRALAVNGLSAEWAQGQDVLRRVNFRPQQLALSYVLRSDSAEQIVSALIPPGEQQRLKAYSDQLAALAAAAAADQATSLARWMGPIFSLARQRSAGGDAAAENRAAIVMLTLYANGHSLGSMLPAARLWQRPRPTRLTLAGRDDSPLHLLVSAALVVEGSSPLSRAIGLYKEIADSRGGSGFSFNDLAADRAGTRLGEMALNQPERLQALLAAGVDEADFMPHAADLPEGMPEPEFKRRFGGVGAPRYAAMVAEIDRRVSALRALR